MIDVIVLTTLTYNYVQRRKRKRAEEVLSDEVTQSGRGDQLFNRLGGKKFFQGEALGIFFFFLFLRVALYAPIFSFSLDAATGRYGIIDIHYKDSLQGEIVRFGIQGLTLLVPVWLPLVAGLNLVNQLDKDFPQKQEYKRLVYGCEVKRDFSDCERIIIFHHLDDTSENFEKAILRIQKFMTDEKQICEIYRFRSEFSRRLMHTKGEVHTHTNKDCDINICSGCRYW